MTNHIIWYNLHDGSYGSCHADDLLIIDDSTLTMEEGQELYVAAKDGEDEKIRDLLVSIHKRQDTKDTTCG